MPSRRTWPSATSYRRGSKYASVVLPLPVRPTMPTVSPGSMTRLRSRRIHSSDFGYLNPTPRSSMWPRQRSRVVGDLRARVDHLVQPLRGGLALLAHREDPADGVHRPREHEDVVHEGDETADGEAALDHMKAAEEKHRHQR